MGYDTGKLVGNVNENGVCTEFESKNHCADDEVKILVKNVECTGTEAKFSDCSMEYDT
jgi:hypothetical protein